MYLNRILASQVIRCYPRGMKENVEFGHPWGWSDIGDTGFWLNILNKICAKIGWCKQGHGSTKAERRVFRGSLVSLTLSVFSVSNTVNIITLFDGLGPSSQKAEQSVPLFWCDRGTGWGQRRWREVETMLGEERGLHILHFHSWTLLADL